MRGARVLITGAAGFIGANLCREMLHRGALVHALVRPTTDLRNIRQIASSISIHHADLLERGPLFRVVKRIRPDYVFHLATTRAADTAEARDATLRVGVLGLFNLLEATRDLGYRRLVNLGSSLEYGPSDTPHSETDPIAPSLVFGAAKAAATVLAQQYGLDAELPIVTLRVFSVYGFWEPRNRLIPTAIRAALNGGELALTRPGLRHDLVFVEDVISACLRAATARHAAGEVFNIGTGTEWANEQVVAMIEDLLGVSIRKRIGAFPPHDMDTAHWVANTRKAEQQLGWRPRHNLESGLRKTISWWKSHPDIPAGPRGSAPTR